MKTLSTSDTHTLSPCIRMLLAGMVFLLAFPAFSQTTETREVNRSYPFRPGAQLEIESKHGELTIHTWEREEVKLEAELRVSGKNESAIAEVMERMDVVVEAKEGNLRISTEFGDTQAINSEREGMEIQYRDGSKVRGIKERSINLDLYIPRQAALSFSHKYGSAYLDDHDGSLNMEIRHGSLRTERLTGPASLEIAHSSASLAALRQGQIELQHGSLDLEEADQVTLESSYSAFNAGTVQDLILEQKHGSSDIQQVGSLTFEDKYSEFRIGQVTQRLSGESKYSNLVVKSLHSGFQLVEIEGKYGSIAIHCETGAAYSLLAEAENSSVNIPRNIQTQEDITERNYRKVAGRVNGGGNARIILEMDYGNLSVQ